MNLGIFDLIGMIMLVLAGTSFVYLLRVKNKSGSTWMLFWFFLCVVLSSIATIVTNIGTAWDWAFAPSQDAMLILGRAYSWWGMHIHTRQATNQEKLVR